MAIMRIPDSSPTPVNGLQCCCAAAGWASRHCSPVQRFISFKPQSMIKARPPSPPSLRMHGWRPGNASTRSQPPLPTTVTALPTGRTTAIPGNAIAMPGGVRKIRSTSSCSRTAPQARTTCQKIKTVTAMACRIGSKSNITVTWMKSPVRTRMEMVPACPPSMPPARTRCIPTVPSTGGSFGLTPPCCR